MTINLTIPDIQELKPRITVFGVGGAGGNAVNNMIASGLDGVDFAMVRQIRMSNQLSDEALELFIDLPRLAGSNAWVVAPGRSAKLGPSKPRLLDWRAGSRLIELPCSPARRIWQLGLLR